MERNIGAPNRRLPPDVEPKGSTRRDLGRRQEPDDSEQLQPEPDADVIDHD